ncbi:MAG: hypothetical protein GY787_08195, partial [Alteromonadales bacterium]|nr:hypothetical protein [Alteromonadales bacterium]
DYENWSLTSGTATVFNTTQNGIELELSSERPLIDSSVYAFKNSTQYTIVTNCTVNTLASSIRTTTAGSLFTTSTVVLDHGVLGEKRTLMQTDSNVSNSFFRLLPNATTSGNVTFEIAVYEGDYVTGSPTLPTSNEVVTGNSVILADKYNGITKYDTNRIQTETDGTGKVLPIADMLHITNNQMFATEDKKNIGFFDKELTGDCKNKAITFFKQGEQLTDQNGDLLFDAQGNALFTFKPWVTN